jgi:hypothetical protein
LIRQQIVPMRNLTPRLENQCIPFFPNPRNDGTAAAWGAHAPSRVVVGGPPGHHVGY